MRPRHRITLGTALGVTMFIAWTHTWPRWLYLAFNLTIVAFILLIIVTEIIVRWRKSRPIPSMKSLSPEDANAIVGGAPVFIHPENLRAPKP